uniref:NADH-ubiquinone oxidoreductase chain 6 n=1 Tax=Spongiocaris panglao TaxID=1986577 RepID=A0A345F0M9_9EUCA|nr:NADH dehydrogenase subunit 6 [Spongiocaris panglao]AXG21504.1 NADH dehydrogenase subunit 6 [Spongiocaris panglao]
MTVSISLLPIMISISLIFLSTVHPLASGLTLLFQTIIICIMAGLFMSSFWFSYILFLIFLGGMLVLFIYVASLAPNEPFSISLPLMIFIMFLLMMTLLLMIWDPIMKMMNSKTPSSYFYLLYSTSLQTLTTKTFYNPPISNLTLFTILYLLLSLIMVVKITDHSSGTLRLSN